MFNIIIAYIFTIVNNMTTTLLFVRRAGFVSPFLWSVETHNLYSRFARYKLAPTVQILLGAHQI